MKIQNYLILAFATIFSPTYGQGNLNSFRGIKAALLGGNELQLNADPLLCDTSQNEVSFFISIPMRQWQIVTSPTGVQEIRSDDYYIETGVPEAITWITRTLRVLEDDSVLVIIDVVPTAPDLSPEQIISKCSLGVGANVHRVINGNDLVELETYQALKLRLLLGDHVEAIGLLNECSNAEEVFMDGSQYVIGYQIPRFEVNGDGTLEEFLAFDDAAVLSYAAGSGAFTIGTERVLVYPDGSVNMRAAILNPDLSVASNFSLNCNLGSALRVTVHERENEDTYTTYSTIKAATLSGHDMELVVFSEYCEALQGDPIGLTGHIGSDRFDQFQLFEDVEKEYIAYTTWGLALNGGVYVETANVYEDDSVIVEYFYGSPSSAEIETGKASCPLVQASLFHAVSRTRAPAVSFYEVAHEIIERGQTFEIEVDYSGCENGGVEFGSIYGGVAWEAYIEPSGGFYYTNIFALETQNITGTFGPAWYASGIILDPDNAVYIFPAIYDYYTGENLVVDDSGPIVCRLATGDGSGSVNFYRYP